MPQLILASLILPFLLSVGLCAAIRRVALRRGFVDRPGGHKGHDAPVALGGGIAICLSVVMPMLTGVAFAVFVRWQGYPGWVPNELLGHVDGVVDQAPTAGLLVAGALGLMFVGLRDDVRPLGPGFKFAVQIAVAGVLTIVCGIRAMELWGTPAAVGLTMIWMITIINAFNFLDNMDGLAAGVAAIVAALLAVAAIWSGQFFVPVLCLTVVGAACGFLIFNFPPATLFMGDAGSLVLGYFLAVLTVMTTYVEPDQEATRIATLVPVVVLAVPLYDVVSVVLLRLRAGDSPFRGDRRHFSHRLVTLGMRPRSAVLTIYLATLATGLSATLLPRADLTTACLIVAQCLCIVMIIAVLEHKRAHGNAS